MDDQKIRRWAGGFGVGGFVVFLAALPLYFLGVGPGVPLEKTAEFGEFVARTSSFVIIRATWIVVVVGCARHWAQRVAPQQNAFPFGGTRVCDVRAFAITKRDGISCLTNPKHSRRFRRRNT